MTDEKLVITYVPSLGEMLQIFEEEKGSPLIEEEVIDLSKRAICMTLPESVHAKLEQERGYKDIMTIVGKNGVILKKPIICQIKDEN